VRSVSARLMRTQVGKHGPMSVLLGLLLVLAAACASAEDGWIADKNGCKIANPSPKPGETVTWSGACANGFAQGQGVVQWYKDGKPGVTYEGALARGAASGQGKLTMPDGATYAGGWLDGKQDGSGKYSAPGGARYEGEWKDGAPNGRGIMHGASGEVMDGVWKAGTYVGPAAEQ
jgi:hypothetical protein